MVGENCLLLGGCGGCPNRGPWVPARGHGGKVCIVGEAPGRNELFKGLPFIGPAGQLLNAAMTRAGFDGLDSCYITNAMMCRPPETPIPNSTIDACRPRLLHELMDEGPFDLIIALGNPAIRSLMSNHKLKVSSTRGQVFESELGQIISTYHPAAILRDHTKYKAFLTDLSSAYQLTQGNKKEPGETQYFVVTLENLERTVSALIQKEYLSCDIETTGFDHLSDRLLCFGVGFGKNQVAMFGLDLWDKFKELIRKLFETKGPKWIFHNGKFDLKFLRSMGWNARVDEDTMLMHYALDEIRATHDLGQLARVYLGAPNYKDWMKQWKGHFEYAPKKVLYDYCAKDVDYTYQLREVLWAEMCRPENAGLPELYRETLLPSSDFLLEVEESGIYVDREQLDNLEAEMQRQFAEVDLRCTELASPYWDADLYARQEGVVKRPGWFNAGSPQQVSWLIYKRMGLTPKKGFKRTTEEQTLKNLERSHPFIDALLERRGILKAINTYVEGVRKAIAPDERIHTTFKIHGTVTGRLSSGEDDEVKE